MHFVSRFALVFVAALLGAAPGCDRESSSNAAPPAPASAKSTTNAVATAQTKGKPQPKLKTIKLWLGAEEIDAEIAATSEQVQTGMMFRTEMGEKEGMIFVFVQPHRTSFYMKNTLVPLTCAYIDAEGIIRELHDMEPLNEKPIHASRDDIQYVLEMKRGWFERHKIGVGTVIRSERGSLSETFFVRAKRNR